MLAEKAAHKGQNDKDTEYDHTSHGGRASLVFVDLGAVLANGLTRTGRSHFLLENPSGEKGSEHPHQREKWPVHSAHIFNFCSMLRKEIAHLCDCPLDLPDL